MRQRQERHAENAVVSQPAKRIRRLNWMRALSCRTVVTVVAGLLVGSASPDKLCSQAVPNEVSCARCTIQVKSLFRVGGPEGPGSLTGKPISVVEDSLGRFWVAAPPALPTVFDAKGRFLQQIGRKGRGPGEFVNASYIAALPGDSMLVFDWSQRRAVVVAANFAAVRHVQLPGSMWRWGVAVASWPDRVILSALLSVGEAAGWPLHEMTFNLDKATIVASFGPNGGQMRTQDVFHLGQRLSRPRNGRLWTLDEQQYRVTQWGAGGSRLKQIDRRPSWFAGISSLRPGDHDTPPSPAGAALAEDSNDRLWVFTEVAAPDWKLAWENVPRVKGNDARESSAARGPAFSQLYRTMVEIIDTRSNRVISRTALNHMQVVAVLRGNRVAVYSLDEDDRPVLSIVQLALLGI